MNDEQGWILFFLGCPFAISPSRICPPERSKGSLMMKDVGMEGWRIFDVRYEDVGFLMFYL
jgi:hypothetical protein